MKLIIIIIINIEKKKKFVQNLKWATAHLSRRLGRWGAGLGAGREGVWQAAGRALGAARHGRCKQRGRGRAEQAAAGARGARQAGRRRWARAGHAAGARPGHWAPGLALGSALGALGPFSIRFDSFFFFSRVNK